MKIDNLPFALVTIAYIILIGFLMWRFDPMWFLALLLWGWSHFWDEDKKD